MPELILASSSRYRQELLRRLGLPFRVVSPDIDESPRPGEAAAALVERLAAAKAAKVGARLGEGVVVASDQVAVVAGPEGERILGKPGGRAKAIAQLAELSGREVYFLTSLCVREWVGGSGGSGAGARHAGSEQLATETTLVQFRNLSAAEIERYVEQDQPFDCCGAFRSEGLGTSLLQRIESSDPSALVGLPLIRLCAMLRRVGLNPLG